MLPVDGLVGVARLCLLKPFAICPVPAMTTIPCSSPLVPLASAAMLSLYERMIGRLVLPLALNSSTTHPSNMTASAGVLQPLTPMQIDVTWSSVAGVGSMAASAAVMAWCRWRLASSLPTLLKFVEPLAAVESVLPSADKAMAVVYVSIETGESGG